MSTILNELENKQTLNNSGWSGIFDVTSDMTNQALGLYTMTYAAGAKGADLHYHKKMLEIFNVLEGSISVFINGEWRTVHTGGTVIIPTLTVHGFRPLPKIGCKIQILFTPNIKREDFFLGFNLRTNVSDEEKYEFWAQFDQYPPETLQENT